MTPVTTRVRAEIVRRLLLLDENSTAKIGAVIDPESVRSPSNRAPAPLLTAVLWTMPGRLLGKQGSRVKWSQEFAIDIAVPWSADAEVRCDGMRLELAAVLCDAFAGLPIQKQELSELSVGYPSEGSAYALVSVSLTFEYVETLEILTTTT